MNITIRKMQPGDTDALYKLLSDPEVMRHLEPPFDREKTETFLHHAGLIDRARQERKSVVIECAPAQEATKRIASKKGFRDCGICDGLAVYRLP